MMKTIIASAILMATTTFAMADTHNPHQFEKCMAAALDERPGTIIKVEFKNRFSIFIL